RLPVETPEQFARDIARAIRSLAMNPAERLTLGRGARTRLMSFGTWEEKAASTVQMYRDILASRTLRQL
ncbi:MAG: hypothetical protein Q7T25_13330, partial [Sideroxyarcus sp.]|nr:hypothetical protein [Sideroxyarcus sp.]